MVDDRQGFTLTQVLLLILLSQVQIGIFAVLLGFVVGMLVFAPDDRLPTAVSGFRAAILPYIQT